MGACLLPEHHDPEEGGRRHNSRLDIGSPKWESNQVKVLGPDSIQRKGTILMRAVVRRLWWHVRLWLVRIRARLLRADQRARIMVLGFEAAKRDDFGGFFRTVDLVGGLSGWGVCTLAAAALVYYRAGQATEAGSLFATALEEGADDPYVLKCYGKYLYQEERFAESLECLKKAVSGCPNDSWALAWLGGAYFRMGDTQEARRCYAESLRQGPAESDVGSVYSGLAHAMARLEDWDEAARCWREAASRLPRDEEVWYNLGDALLHIGRYREAIEALKRNLRLGSQQPDWTLYDIARCYQQLGDVFRASRFCDKALEHAPDDEDALALKSELGAALAG